jgi:hypothetical protein
LVNAEFGFALIWSAALVPVVENIGIHPIDGSGNLSADCWTANHFSEDADEVELLNDGELESSQCRFIDDVSGNIRNLRISPSSIGKNEAPEVVSPSSCVGRD